MASTPLSSYDDVIFDFDGTLADLRVDWNALRHAMSVEVDGHSVGAPRSLAEMIAQASLEGGWPARRRLAALIERFEQPDGRVHVAPIAPSLRIARELSHFHIISNNLTSTVDMALADLGIASGCAHVVGFESSLRSKPADDGYRVLAKAVALGERIAYVGDRASDRVFAEACGLDFFHVSELCE